MLRKSRRQIVDHLDRDIFTQCTIYCQLHRQTVSQYITVFLLAGCRAAAQSLISCVCCAVLNSSYFFDNTAAVTAFRLTGLHFSGAGIYLLIAQVVILNNNHRGLEAF
ncbi:hypothetical protein KZ770_08880 [Escherichia coli]|nr:hypothetical protein [Escherichia coli]